MTWKTTPEPYAVFIRRCGGDPGRRCRRRKQTWKVGQGSPVRIATRSTARASNKNPVDQTASGSSAPTAVLGAGPDISQAQPRAGTGTGPRPGPVSQARSGQVRFAGQRRQDWFDLIQTVDAARVIIVQVEVRALRLSLDRPRSVCPLITSLFIFTQTVGMLA